MTYGRRLVMAVVGSLISAGCSALFAAGPVVAEGSRSSTSKDLPNFHQVHPYLFRAGEPTEAGLEALSRMGVKTVVDLRNPGEKKIPEAAICEKLKMEYLSLPMNSAPPTSKQVRTITDKIKGAKSNPESGSVLVHCAHGSDRTGCIIGIWRVTEDGWSYEDAYKEMRKYYFTPKFTRLSGCVRDYADRTRKP